MYSDFDALTAPNWCIRTVWRHDLHDDHSKDGTTVTNNAVNNSAAPASVPLHDMLYELTPLTWSFSTMIDVSEQGTKLSSLASVLGTVQPEEEAAPASKVGIMRYCVLCLSSAGFATAPLLTFGVFVCEFSCSMYVAQPICSLGGAGRKRQP